MYISLDIGGTKLMAASFTESHQLLSRERVDTPQALDHGMAILKQLAHAVAGGRTIRALGASAGGPLNYRTGVVSPLHMPAWRDVPLKAIIEAEFKAPFAVDVDTNAAALAEYSFGGNRSSRLLYITVSTGMGGGFVVDGELYRGADGAHPEIGHQAIAHTLPVSGTIACSCGGSDCVEAVVSGSAIRKHYGKPAEELSAAEWEQVGDNLGKALRNAATLYAPDQIVLGGGVCVGGGERLVQQIQDLLDRNLKLVPSPKVTLSALGYDTALWGGLAMALRAEAREAV
jgi:predicted NBD/HSP70 family sugar kinase